MIISEVVTQMSVSFTGKVKPSCSQPLMPGDNRLKVRIEMATPVSWNLKLRIKVVRIALYSNSASFMPTQILGPSEKAKRPLLQPSHIWFAGGTPYSPSVQYLASRMLIPLYLLNESLIPVYRR